MVSNSFLRIGIDIGGTFSDFVVYDPLTHSFETFKLMSTPADPAIAVIEGLRQIFTARADHQAAIIHGSTVATNALLERKGALTALVSTAGFRDVLQIGRQNRPSLYDLTIHKPESLVPPELRFEANERILHTGEVLRDLDPMELEILTEKVIASGAEAAAVCLLFSFLHPQHERQIAERLRQAGLFVSVSSEILPEYREYERTSTTVVNAYVSPVLSRYLSHLEAALEPEMRLRIMQSNGGAIQPEEARRAGVRCILSGPAGGVVGCEYVGRAADPDGDLHLIGFDMGGTSTDVSLLDGKRQITTEAEVSGCPIHLPILDIHTIGAGGGSIARVDAGGALRVGPESAGADPGPACYGIGDLPTVTDANLVLGRLAADQFLGGSMALDNRRAYGALARLGLEIGMDAEAAALGVIQVANAHMERALRVISVERGHDPRTFTLLSFGGAGGLHAADLARSLGIPRVLIPPMASTLSAFGMLVADVVLDYTLTVMLPADTPAAQLRERFKPLSEKGMTDLLAEGVPKGDIRLEYNLDMRYLGQSYELNVPFSPDFQEVFHNLHQANYGYARPQSVVEIVNLRLRAVGKSMPPPLVTLHAGDSDLRRAYLETRPVIFSQGDSHEAVQTPFYRAEALLSGDLLSGPAVVARADTTVLLNVSDRGSVDRFGNLIIEVGT